MRAARVHEVADGGGAIMAPDRDAPGLDLRREGPGVHAYRGASGLSGAVVGVVFRRGRIVASLRKDETDGNDIMSNITGVKGGTDTTRA